MDILVPEHKVVSMTVELEDKNILALKIYSLYIYNQVTQSEKTQIQWEISSIYQVAYLNTSKLT